MRRKVGRPPSGANGTRIRDYPQLSLRVPPRLLQRFTTRVKPLSPSRALLNYIAKTVGL